MKLKLTGYVYGMNKAASDKLLAREAGLGLMKGKQVVDRVMAGETVEIVIDDHDQAMMLAEALREQGILCEVE